MDDLRSDCILREILEQRKSLTGFLDAIFGFLSRNTDFYHVLRTKDDKQGFPRGVKEQILMSCMQKYENKLQQEQLEKDNVVEPPTFVAEEIVIETEENIEGCGSISTAKTDIKLHANENKHFATTSKFNESEYKNGSMCGNYCWSQTLREVDLYVLLPAEVKLAKHLNVNFKSNFIIVKTLLPKEEILINAETWDRYRHKDVIWSISEGKLIISFDKLKEYWWDKLFLNESTIDIKNVSCEHSLHEYSPDVQNEIENLHVEKEYKNKALKTFTPDESEHMARLRQAWDAEGSPFKGQPFDPSIIQFN